MVEMLYTTRLSAKCSTIRGAVSQINHQATTPPINAGSVIRHPASAPKCDMCM